MRIQGGADPRQHSLQECALLPGRPAGGRHADVGVVEVLEQAAHLVVPRGELRELHAAVEQPGGDPPLGRSPHRPFGIVPRPAPLLQQLDQVEAGLRAAPGGPQPRAQPRVVLPEPSALVQAEDLVARQVPEIVVGEHGQDHQVGVERRHLVLDAEARLVRPVGGDPGVDHLHPFRQVGGEAALQLHAERVRQLRVLPLDEGVAVHHDAALVLPGPERRAAEAVPVDVEGHHPSAVHGEVVEAAGDPGTEHVQVAGMEPVGSDEIFGRNEAQDTFPQGQGDHARTQDQGQVQDPAPGKTSGEAQQEPERDQPQLGGTEAGGTSGEPIRERAEQQQTRSRAPGQEADRSHRAHRMLPGPWISIPTVPCARSERTSSAWRAGGSDLPFHGG